jgi:ABC-2 type transport system permease protein
VTTLDLSEFRTPGRGRGILDVFTWRYLLRLLVRKGTQTRYRNSVLGWTWSYVKPAFQFGVFFVVMGLFLGLNRGVDNFAVYLFSGIVVINFFNEGFGNATRSILENGALVQKIYLPRELFPIAAIIVAFVHFVPQAVILLIACLFLGWTPSVSGVLAIALGLVIIAALSLGLGMLFGAVNVSFRDAQNVVELIQMLSTWAAPVLYTWQFVRDAVPRWLFDLYMANPLTAAVELFHAGMWFPTSDGKIPHPEHLWTNAFIALGICVVFLVIGQMVFRRFERRFAQEL